MPAARPRVPRARRDPIRTPDDALAVATLAAASRPRPETIAFLLDDAYRGTGQITVVSDTTDGDCVLRITEVMGEVGRLSRGACGGADPTYLVIATVRPNGGLEQGDAFRWCCASDIADDHGITLLEWFVLGTDGVECPRDLLSEPDRWPRA